MAERRLNIGVTTGSREECHLPHHWPPRFATAIRRANNCGRPQLIQFRYLRAMAWQNGLYGIVAMLNDWINACIRHGAKMEANR